LHLNPKIMHRLFILLGSNLGDRLLYLSQARNMLSDRVGCIELKSHMYESPPWGFNHKNSFLNQVVLIITKLEPEKILQITQQIELDLGRKHIGIGYSARTIDIDLLFYNNEIIKNENLTIPHPQLHNRRFTLLPLNEITPDLIHPVLQSSINELLEKCPDKSKVEKLLF